MSAQPRASQSIALLCLVTLSMLASQAWFNLQHLNYELELAHQQQLSANVDIANSLVEHYQSLEASIGREQAQQLALDALRDLRYQGNEYFWVNDLQMNLLMHPHRADEEGNNMLQVSDAKGYYHWREMQSKVETNDHGYVKYDYLCPQSGNVSAKMSYVKRIEGWDWIIGTGIYLTNIKLAVKNGLYITIGIFSLCLVICLLLARAMHQTLKTPGDEQKATRDDPLPL